ncbi:MAG: DEAD/DEAH box helicase family protein [Gomphosphaeria aponina SAG 52.96 = DSM 107014]|uniref:DEAD/DEAH box helicase family protein n=1 Tax=Gomphosphaeria aponina SAG 52.96 = DSM 107014 TaxID=1521640 RepID=A0A941JSH2_9CHRO|nr:DEAD/DEAH box helicase family protein [Gomphosphaeria aponina SAG 52.96 = DSM 107014]
MSNEKSTIKLDWMNLLGEKEEVSLPEYLETYKARINQASEVLFVTDFLYPFLGSKNIKYVIPQYPFIDSEGHARRIDFGLVYNNKKIALEVNGETYHAEGIIPNEMFDDNLNRQNEILNAGWFLLRYSYSQLQSPKWRTRVKNSLFNLLRKRVPELLSERIIEPNYLQRLVLDSLDYYRAKGWKKGIVVLPTGTGKTFLAAFDTLKTSGRILFIVHRLDILTQSKEAFEKVYPKETLGLLTGEVKENLADSKVLFASKDSLRNPEILSLLSPNEFDYIILDEIHHGQAPSYQLVLQYFQPIFFMLGLTATPDRMDRKDIFELFDYQKVYEYSLSDAIENGFLVPYTYYGLQDNIDYNNLRHNGSKYNLADLDRSLIIKERNEKIYEEYLQKGSGHKALGFCCSVKHANAMADFFNSKGIPAVSITSSSDNRDELTQSFRENKYTVAFTVDLFNEGVDFPDIRVLLFLRPTESKTVFFQQLGRGLRLCGGKDKVVVIDFIGNYKKANNIRKYLSKVFKPKVNQSNGRVEKIEYEYSPKCEVIFDAEVEEILDRQDTSEREISKEDLIDAYYKLAETLKRKPTQEDINRDGEFKISRYLVIFGSWVNFLKDIGEHTEFSYHFPQGTHLGHVMYILKTVGSDTIQGSHIAPEYVRFAGGYGKGNIAKFQRQTKYKLQALMELGLLLDYRQNALAEEFKLALTNDGKKVYKSLKPFLDSLDFSFKTSKTAISWSMNCESSINQSIRNFLGQNLEAKKTLRRIFLEMDAVNLLLKYLYAVQRVKSIKKSDIYDDFFEAPFVKAYLDRYGLENPTQEVRRRRIPFLLNILDSLGIINQGSSKIEVLSFVPAKEVMKFSSKEHEEVIVERIAKLQNYNNTGQKDFSADEISLFKETFGAEFLTEKYYLQIGEI